MMFQPGERVELLLMLNDPDPLPRGLRGTVTRAQQVDFGGGDRFVQYTVEWDDGRTLMPCVPPDILRRIEA